MKRTNYYVPTELHSRLKSYSEQSGVPMSEVMRRALEQYLDEYCDARKERKSLVQR